MKKWQEKRNYRRFKDENGNAIANVITVDGEIVEVTDAVYQVYSQTDRRERYITEEVEPGMILSLDKLLEDEIPLETLGVELEDSAESLVLEREQLDMISQQKSILYSALDSLDQPERQLIESLFFEEVSIREYSRRIGVTHRAIIKRRDRILVKLKSFFENFDK